ncbi:MAG: glycoside hydrolase family 3 C-terminal domain-containing protein [Solirubrobacterales bacterium]|nr:glycoside hydrolase family 3 C-terminal domain-containing protein [Solirubrobacterales bacterium]
MRTFADFKVQLRGKSRTRYLKAVSTLKHYALNNVEKNRTSISSNTDEATIRDYYTAQFRRLIERFGATGLMSAYNAVNGTPAVADSFLLNNLARRSWGFNGYVTSDCGAVATTYRLPGEAFGPGGPVELSGHDWAPPGWSSDHGGGAASTWTRKADGAEVSGPAGGEAFSLRAGTALNCSGAGIGNQGFRSWFGQENEAGLIEEAIRARILGQGVIDRALQRVFTLRMRTGEFDPRSRVGFSRIRGRVIDSGDHRRLTGQVARRSLVLLRNKRFGSRKRRLLPVDPAEVRKIVVLGDLAGRVVLGGYSGKPTEEIDVRDGESYLARTSPQAEVVFDDAGTSTTATGPAVIGEGTRSAIREADFVLMMVGTDEKSSNEGSDRASLAMPGNYSSMIRQVNDIGNRNRALYVQSAGPVSLGAAGERVPAVLFSGPNGQRQGSALASVLFGGSEPSGRLSFTWYRNDSQLPPISDYDLTPEKTKGLGRTYQYFTGKPRFPFGHGLSYTKFRYSKAKLPRRARASGRIPAGITVTNTGRRAGSTVLQIYAAIHARRGGRRLPVRRLIGFARSGVLKPGRSRRLNWRIPVERLRLFDPKSDRDVVYQGRYRLTIGTSSARTVAGRRVKIAGRLPRKIEHVTVEAPRMVLNRGQKLNLKGRNFWLSGPGQGRGHAANRIIAAARDDQSFVNLRRRRVNYSSNRPGVLRVGRGGVVTGVRRGTGTITVSVGGTKGRASFVVR